MILMAPVRHDSELVSDLGWLGAYAGDTLVGRMGLDLPCMEEGMNRQIEHADPLDAVIEWTAEATPRPQDFVWLIKKLAY